MTSASGDTQSANQNSELAIDDNAIGIEINDRQQSGDGGGAVTQMNIDVTYHTQIHTSANYGCESDNKVDYATAGCPSTATDDACTSTTTPGEARDDYPSASVGAVQHHNVLESGDNFFVTYFGELVLDQRHTHQILPWVMAEVRRRQQTQLILLQVLSQTLRAITCDSTASSHLMFEHKLQSLSRFARSHQDPKCFAYLTRTRTGSVYTCHVFQASDEPMVHEVFGAIRDATKETVKDDQCLQDLIPPDSPLDATGLSMQVMMTHLYEVLFVGRVIVSAKKTPPTFIDEVIDKFQEQQKVAEFERRRNVSGTSVRSLPADLEVTVRVCENELSHHKTYRLNGSVDSNDTVGTDGSGGDPSGLGDSTGCLDMSGYNELEGGMAHEGCKNLQPTYDPENRIRLIQVGDTELCLISPDRKSVILQRKFKDISFCSQGIKYRDHFGFISREQTSTNFLCYVFKCSDESVVEEIMKTLKQAFQQAFQKNSRNHIVCPLCPMRQLHQLCVIVNKLPADQVNELLLKRVCHLREKDRSEIIQRLETENPSSVGETNEVLMGVLREMCEAKQASHIHMGECSKAQAKNEFNLMDCGKSKSSRFDTLRNRAKRSLTNSFESLIRGRNKRGELKYYGRRWTLTNHNGVAVIEDKQEDEVTRGRRWTITSDTGIPHEEDSDKSVEPSEVSDGQTSNPAEESTSEEASQIGRPRSFTAPPGGCDLEPVLLQSNHKTQKPSKSVVPSFFRIESYLRSNVMAGGRRCVEQDPEPPAPPPQGQTPPEVQMRSGRRPSATHRQKSWRLEILNRVVTPVSRGNSLIDCESPGSTMKSLPEMDVIPAKLSPRELRELWRKAILEVLLLIKMERENKSLRVRQTEAELKRLKLDYEEITPCLKPVADVWDDMLRTPEGIKIDMNVIHDAVVEGVPRNKRGDVWWLLMEQHKLHRRKGQQPVEELTVQYKDLLKQLTSYQHAILIDLGRTFPSHPYFARQLGAGQLSLFNLLKAYSLLDKQVGYCQGLSFVAGVLLMHMPEEQSFEALRYILYSLGFRQQYESDMVSMQIQLYQLSRLLHDHHPDLYRHLEAHEIAPVHYSAAWFLTMFASEFPLAFVSRVFDLIFLQGIEIIFKVALVLLDNHKDMILQCHSIESIMTFLKTTLPNMGVIRMEQVFNQVFVLDISNALQAYEVEYHVLQEEMASPRQFSAEEQQLQATNEVLRCQNTRFAELLQRSESRATSLEQSLRSNRSHTYDLEQDLQALRHSHSELQAQVDSLQRERAALLKTVDVLQAVLPEGAVVARGHMNPSESVTRDVLESQMLENIPTERSNPISTGVGEDIEMMAGDDNKVIGQGRLVPREGQSATS